jgi:hypothetical protein
MDFLEEDTDIPQWQKDALDAELENISKDPNYLLKWEDVKQQFFE